MRAHHRSRILIAFFLLVGLFSMTLTSRSGYAQDASPVADGPSSPEQDGTATPIPALPTVPPETADATGNWPVPQGDLAGTRNAVGSTIDSSTVGQLAVAWTFDLTAAGFFGAVTANPIVSGDTVYLQDMQSNVFAFDKTTGSLKWKTDFNVGSIGPNGVTIAYGMIYAALSDTGEVVALNATDGSEVWRQKIGSPPGEGIDMAPIAYDGLVYVSTVPGTGIGPTFYNGGDRGVLYVLDARSGEVAWWWDTTGDNNAWGGAKVAGGGGLWYPPSFDESGNLYFGVGNPAPWPMTEECPNGSCRPGDNLYTSSIVSLDGQTGGLRWYYQDRPHDLLDLDFQQTPVLATVNINGTDTPIAIGSGKTGNVVAVNRDTGEVVWKLPVGKHQNDGNGDLPTDSYVEVYPGSYGGVESPIAYANGKIFVTYVDYPQYQGATGSDPNTSAPLTAATGGLLAINAADGTVAWENTLPTFVVGATTVSNDLVFTSGLDGVFRAFDVNSGQEVWNWEADAGINAPPAIAGDMIFVGAGFAKFPQVGATPTADAGAAPKPQLIALRIGGASDATPVPTEATVAPTAEPTVAPTEATTGGTTGGTEIDMVDIAFMPNTITIQANTDVTINLVNKGVAVHNFNVDQLNIHSGDFTPGQTGTVTINAAPGTYEYYCSIPGHKEAGMVGTIVVQ